MTPRPAARRVQRPAPAWLSLLACPACRQNLLPRASNLVCRGCGRVYPVHDGVPDLLLRETLGPEMCKSLDSWDREWQRLGLPPRGQLAQDSAYASALQHIREHAPGPDWGVFLEAGCGNGKIALLVAQEKKARLVVGIDCSREACRQAKKLFAREHAQGLFVVGDLRRLPFRDGVLDYIFGWGSLEHFPDTSTAVQEAFRVLRPRGRVTHTVPIVSLATLTYYQLWGNIPELPLVRPAAEWLHLRLLGGRHLRYGYEKSFLPGGLAGYFRRAGFRSIRWGRLDVYLKFERPLWEWLKRLARWLARWRPFWPMMYLDADK